MNKHPFVREMLQRDSQSVLEIYRMGIETGNATFETIVPSWQEWDSKHLPHSRFVFEEDGIITGWAALSNREPQRRRREHRGKCQIVNSFLL